MKDADPKACCLDGAVVEAVHAGRGSPLAVLEHVRARLAVADVRTLFAEGSNAALASVLGALRRCERLGSIELRSFGDGYAWKPVEEVEP